MNRICKCEVQKLFPILEAIKEGKTIQFKDSDGWRDINGDDEGFYLNTLVEETDKYRIKIEPKYRSFKNAEECWLEMQKHQPFGWVKWNDVRYNIYVVSLTSVSLINGNCKNMDFAYAYQKLIFDDGAPFGIKVEE